MQVTPTQSAFYAGEQFSCNITFRNSHPLPSSSASLASSSNLKPAVPSLGQLKKGHRSAVSLGVDAFASSPTARLPSTPLSASFASTSKPLPVRKGLIGADADAVASRRGIDSLEPPPSASNGLYAKRRLPTNMGHRKNNYSVAMSSPDLLGDLSQEVAHDQRRPSAASSRAASKPSLPPVITEEEPTPHLGSSSNQSSPSTLR